MYFTRVKEVNQIVDYAALHQIIKNVRILDAHLMFVKTKKQVIGHLKIN